jgi:predicted RNase H-like HicB family nuclease
MLRIESEREEDGRWIAELPALPGVLSYGATEAEAQAKVKALALRVGELQARRHAPRKRGIQ